MDGANQTYITLDGFVELHKYRYLYFSVFFLVYISIVFCNGVIVYLIWRHSSLHEPMYVFIAALLLNSVLFSSIIYPKLLADVLSERPALSFPACCLQFFLFYSVAASEFLLLSAMAYDRYVSICRPLLYPVVMTTGAVHAWLGAAWLAPASLMAVLVTLSARRSVCSHSLRGILCNNALYGLHCGASAAVTVLGILVLVATAFLPLLFILFTYGRISVLTYRSGSELRRKAARTCLPHVLVLVSFTCLCAFDVITARLDSNFSKLLRLVMTSQAFFYHPLFNPIIYGIKMKEISKHLKTFLFGSS